jgi:predicted dehydrogenase
VISQVKGTGVFRIYQPDDDGAYPQGWSVLDASGAVLGDADPRPNAPARGPRVVKDARPVSGQLQGPAPDIAHWADCVAGRAEPILSGAHARHVVEIMEKAAQSSLEGRALELTTTFPDVIRTPQAVA